MRGSRSPAPRATSSRRTSPGTTRSSRTGTLSWREATTKRKPKHPELRLILCSVGPLLGRLRRFVRENRLEDVLFAGRVSDADKARFYRAAHILCAPSTGQESFGIVLLEAMAAGLPVVASDIHGYKRVVQRNISGLLVEPRDSDAIAAALERLICEPALRVRLGEAGARRAPEFDWSHVTAQLVGVYEEVIQRRRATVGVS